MAACTVTTTLKLDAAAIEAALYGPAVDAAVQRAADNVADDAAAIQTAAAARSGPLANEGLTVAELTRAKPIVFWSSPAAGRAMRKVAGGGRSIPVPVALVVSDSSHAQNWEFGDGLRPPTAALRTAAMRSGGRFVPLIEEAR